MADWKCPCGAIISVSRDANNNVVGVTWRRKSMGQPTCASCQAFINRGYKP